MNLLFSIENYSIEKFFLKEKTKYFKKIMIKNLKEFNIEKKYYWVAKTPSGKYIENMFSKNCYKFF